uniref:Anti-sigma factor MucA n=1 Tax=uncultured bacterium UPO53 TaxID=1776978 RepID=A0A126SYE7_9BACT|nr:anti-sigma factor MucA [uncultured bacterium UPO53]
MNRQNDAERVSALMDGELEGAEQDRAIDSLRDPALADAWRRWQFVRATLRHEASDATDLSARIAARIAAEPAVLAPAALARPRPAQRRVAVAAALAACLTLGVGIWLWNAGGEAPADARFQALYATAPQVTVASDSAGPATPAASTLSDNERENAYIVEHAEYAHRGLSTGLRDFTRVAMADEAVGDSDDGAGM